MKELLLEGVCITVAQKPIQNMYLRIRQTDGRVLLTAPQTMPEADILRFAQSRLSWIQTHLSAIGESDALPCGDGERLSLWGESYLLEVREVPGKQIRVLTQGRCIQLLAPQGSDERARAAALERWYRSELMAAVARVLPGHEQTVGKHAAGWRVRSMSSRWGTCNTATGVITLNLQLARRDPQCLDYVIIHELTHLYEPGHNARFYALLDRFCPDWKQVRRQLKQGV